LDFLDDIFQAIRSLLIANARFPSGEAGLALVDADLNSCADGQGPLPLELEHQRAYDRKAFAADGRRSRDLMLDVIRAAASGA
jgi:hypothetical protein